MEISLEQLKAVFSRTRDRKLILWVILYEDVYETRFGDGRFSYPFRAFFDPFLAERWAAWISENSKKGGTDGYNTEVHPVEFHLDAAGKLSVSPTHEGIPFKDCEARLPAFLNGTDRQWQETVSLCVSKGGEFQESP